MRALVLYIKDLSIKNELFNILYSLIGNHSKHIENKGMDIFYHNYDNDEEIRSLFYSLSTEFMISIKGYYSRNLDIERLNEEINLITPLLNNAEFDIYNIKTIIPYFKDNNDKKMLLNYIISNSGISKEFIKEFAECDLNVSLASKRMFVHRNTMIYKLDKFYEISGFDLRHFVDTYLLYSLIVY